MKDLEDYKKKAEEAIEKEKEAHAKYSEVFDENTDYVENVLKPNNGHLSPEQKQKEQELVEKMREAGGEWSDAIEERKKL